MAESANLLKRQGININDDVPLKLKFPNPPSSRSAPSHTGSQAEESCLPNSEDAKTTRRTAPKYPSSYSLQANPCAQCRRLKVQGGMQRKRGQLLGAGRERSRAEEGAVPRDTRATTAGRVNPASPRPREPPPSLLPSLPSSLPATAAAPRNSPPPRPSPRQGAAAPRHRPAGSPGALWDPRLLPLSLSLLSFLLLLPSLPSPPPCPPLPGTTVPGVPRERAAERGAPRWNLPGCFLATGGSGGAAAAESGSRASPLPAPGRPIYHETRHLPAPA